MNIYVSLTIKLIINLEISVVYLHSLRKIYSYIIMKYNALSETANIPQNNLPWVSIIT